jgi:hypothetical protein
MPFDFMLDLFRSSERGFGSCEHWWSIVDAAEFAPVRPAEKEFLAMALATFSCITVEILIPLADNVGLITYSSIHPAMSALDECSLEYCRKHLLIFVLQVYRSGAERKIAKACGLRENRVPISFSSNILFFFSS